METSGTYQSILNWCLSGLQKKCILIDSLFILKIVIINTVMFTLNEKLMQSHLLFRMEMLVSSL